MTLRLVTFACQECADRGYVPEPFEGRELIPCPACAAVYEPNDNGPDARLSEAIDALDRMVMCQPSGDYRDGLQTALDVVRNLTRGGPVDLADADEEPDYDPAA